MHDILILGGGPAGMACAMELHNAGEQATIIEQQEATGGLARTLEFKEGKHVFRTDIGPHRFFSKNKYLYDFIEHLLKEQWLEVQRQTRQLIEGKFYDYPVNATQVFKHLGLWRVMGIGFSYVGGVIKYRVFRYPIKNFEDFIISNFGYKLGAFSMLNYTEKIWGIPCKRIHADWAKQRIKGLSLLSTAKNALFKKKGDGPKSLVDSFYYPQYGTGLIYETIAQRIKKGGSKIMTKSEPTRIEHKGGKLLSVELSIDGKKQVAKPKHVVSSIPITEFLKLLRPRPPAHVLQAAKGLLWRNQCYLFITLDKEKVTNDNWIYFPNKEVPFGRVAEMKNFSKDMSPPDKTSLFVEFFVSEGDKVWNMSKDELFELSMPWFERLALFTKEEVRNAYLLKRRHVYPVYDLGYPKRLQVIKDYLDTFENLSYIGRPGRFKYTNQDHSLEMGIAAAKGIVEGRRPEFDRIGAEDEYYEQGYIKTGKAATKKGR